MEGEEGEPVMHAGDVEVPHLFCGVVEKGYCAVVLCVFTFPFFDEDFYTEGDSFFKGAGKAVGFGAKGCQDDGYVGVVAADVGEWGSGVHDFPVDELKEGRRRACRRG